VSSVRGAPRPRKRAEFVVKRPIGDWQFVAMVYLPQAATVAINGYSGHVGGR